jgi:fumarate hydratase class II
MMHSIDCVSRSFIEHCANGIRFDEKRIESLVQRSLRPVTALAPKINCNVANPREPAGRH